MKIACALALFVATAAAAQAPPPPPLSLTLTWTETTATTTVSSTTWTLWGNQLTKTEHLVGGERAKDIASSGDVDSTSLQSLIPAFPAKKEITLPASTTAKKTVSASLLVNGSLLVISGPLPEKPTGELAAIIALRDAIEKSAAERAPKTPTPPTPPKTPPTKTPKTPPPPPPPTVG